MRLSTATVAVAVAAVAAVDGAAATPASLPVRPLAPSLSCRVDVLMPSRCYKRL